MLTGLLALLGRVVPKLAPYHAMFGRWFIILMLWCMASSLLIYNVGLPLPIIISFIYLLVSITIGWNAIKVHTNRIKDEVYLRISDRLNGKTSEGSG
jgi:uncharacterized membrane protein